MKELSTSLLESAYEYNNALEQNYLRLAVVLSEIEEKEAWKGEYEDFPDFYKRGLGREKSTVSRLLTAGKWLRENGLADKLPGATPYKRLVQSIKAHPDKDPQYVISEAQTWSDEDYRSSKKEECTHEKPPVLVCPDCWKRVDHA